MNIFFFYFFLIIKIIKCAKIEILDKNDLDSKYNNIEYVKTYQISHLTMRYKSNGGSTPNNDLKNAFNNDDFFPFWQSAKDQDDSFLNNIEILFAKTVTIDRMIFHAAYFPVKNIVGYPLELKIYYKLKNKDGTFNDNDNDSDYLLFDDIISEMTENSLLFTFDEEFTCDQIKLEWADIASTNPDYKSACASEIKFFFPENELINKLLFDVYDQSDYTLLAIKPEYNKLSFIEEIEEELIEYLPISQGLPPLINRIKQIIKGELTFEPRRELTTNQSAEINVINQYGNINEYSRTILKMANGASDRQPTGIYGFSNEKITIFVDANDDDPLPTIFFSQYVGNYTNWLSSGYPLKKGKNCFIIKEFDNSNLLVKVKSGGPIYIENKYTSEEQSQNVKIYIEGGTLFPLFRLNDNENIFKNILNDYVTKYNKSQDEYYNIAELFSVTVMITVNATTAYDLYNIQGESPQENLLNWDNVVRQLYIFDGIQFEENQPYYDERNQYINLHIRYATPYQENIGAYACDTHFGIFFYSSFYNVLVSYDEIGKTQAHEIGHMIDVEPRVYPERTNVVLEEYSVQVIYKKKYHYKKYEVVYESIAPDNIENSLRYCNKDVCDGFFNNAGNYIYPQYVWWNIESFYPGYWSKLNNLYRFNFSLARGLDRNEAMVFFTNLIVGFDTGYYFERMGLAMDNKTFNNSDTSDFYKMKMEKAINEGNITNKTIYKKFWYADSDQYDYILNNGTGCYKNKTKDDYDIEITYIIKDPYRGYEVNFPIIDSIDHLGFEIIENEVIIGFTRKYYFLDRNKYSDNYNPRYKIRAYDRLLNYIESDYKECC